MDLIYDGPDDEQQREHPCQPVRQRAEHGPGEHTEGDTAHHPGDGLPEVGLRHGIVFHALIMPAALANAQRRWLLLARTPTA